MELKPGSRLRSTVCGTEVIVTRAPTGDVAVACGGVAMVPVGDVASAEADALLLGGTLLGKRYVDEDRGLELLCTAAGEGTLTLDGRELTIKGAKPLPSSD